jgi:hypothetical protein
MERIFYHSLWLRHYNFERPYRGIGMKSEVLDKTFVRFHGERIYDEPLVGFVRGDDPLFARYKEVIGPHHFIPTEIMAWQAANKGGTLL